MITYEDVKGAIRNMYNADMISKAEMNGKNARLISQTRITENSDHVFAIRAQIQRLQDEIDGIVSESLADFCEEEDITL